MFCWGGRILWLGRLGVREWLRWKPCYCVLRIPVGIGYVLVVVGFREGVGFGLWGGVGGLGLTGTYRCVVLLYSSVVLFDSG